MTDTEQYHSDLRQIKTDSEERMISDIDILITDNRAEEAQRLLLQSGYIEHQYDNKYSEKKARTTSKHLPPLFHPSRSGYLELHRRNDAEIYHPGLATAFFKPEHFSTLKTNGVTVKVQNVEQLLLYNQTHHHYSAIAKARWDIRQLSEQSVLCHQQFPLSACSSIDLA